MRKKGDQQNLSYDIKEFLKKFFSSRLFVLAAVFIILFATIIIRVFTLQIVNGKSYQENFSLLIQQTRPVEAARGNIYDKIKTTKYVDKQATKETNPQTFFLTTHQAEGGDHNKQKIRCNVCKCQRRKYGCL